MTPPNLLFLYTDEQRYDTLAAYGNSLIHMPNLNRLAEASRSPSVPLPGQPFWPTGCTANNVPLRPETSHLPEMIQHGNYVTAHYGKWHLGDEIFAQHGFDEWRSIEDMDRS